MIAAGRSIKFYTEQGLDINTAIKAAISEGYHTLLIHDIDVSYTSITFNHPELEIHFSENIGQKITLEDCKAKKIDFSYLPTDSTISILGDFKITLLSFQPYVMNLKELVLKSTNKSSEVDQLSIRFDGGASEPNFAKSVIVANATIKHILTEKRIDTFSLVKSTLQEQEGLIERTQEIIMVDAHVNFRILSKQAGRGCASLNITNTVLPSYEFQSLNCHFLTINGLNKNRAVSIANCAVTNLKISNSESIVSIRNSRFGIVEITSAKDHWSSLHLKDCEIYQDLSFSNSTISTIEIDQSKGPDKPFNALTLNKSEIRELILKDLTISSNIQIINSTVTKCSGNNLKFKGPMNFIGTTFEEVPKFFDSSFFPDINFASCEIKNVKPEDLGSLRNLKHQMINIKNERDEIFFSALELEAYTKSIASWRLAHLKMLGYAYRILNNYGRSLVLPTVWLLIIFTLGVLANYSIGVSIDQKSILSAGLLTDLQAFSPMQLAALSSLHNSLGPLKLISQFNILRPNSYNLAMLQFLQTVGSSLMWYFLIIGVRRYFRSQ